MRYYISKFFSLNILDFGRNKDGIKIVDGESYLLFLNWNNQLQIETDKGKLIMDGPSFATFHPGESLHVSTENNAEVEMLAFDMNLFILPNSKLPLLESFRIFEAKNRGVYPLDRNILRKLDRIAGRIKGEFDLDPIPHIEIIRSYLKIMLFELDRFYIARYDNHALLQYPLVVEKFLYFVEKNFIQVTKVQEYASLIGINQKNLAQLVKETLGKTPKEVIADKRMEEAKKLLIQGVLSIKEIAYHLHYDDPAHFSKFFKNHCGITPLEFKESCRKMYT